MSDSKIEEIIMLLSFICALLAYQNDFIAGALIFGAKGVFDFGCVINYALKEILAERQQNNVGSND